MDVYTSFIQISDAKDFSKIVAYISNNLKDISWNVVDVYNISGVFL